MQLSPEQRQFLLAHARYTIATHLDPLPRRAPLPPVAGPELCAGCFVTLKQQGELRGCIGTFSSDRPLIATVAEMAIAAATGDPRFAPLPLAELADTRIEISVLSPLQKIQAVDEIVVGRHGLYLVRGRARGVLLPQVAVEYGWECTTFLEQTCRKAGLSGDAWRDPATEIYTFTAEVFSEEQNSHDS